MTYWKNKMSTPLEVFPEGVELLRRTRRLSENSDFGVCAYLSQIEAFLKNTHNHVIDITSIVFLK